MITAEQVRSGVAIDQHNRNGAIRYKGFFVGNNFYLYRIVEAGVGYRGRTYPCAGWAHVMSDIEEFHPDEIAPVFVPLVHTPSMEENHGN